MPIQFAFLADRADAVPIVAEWYHQEWGYLRPNDSIVRTRARVEEYMNRDKIPFILLARKDNEIVAAAQLKFHEMADLFPEREHWLGGVYVATRHRGQGYGALISEQIAKIAPRYGVQTLHLQTEAPDGGIYARLGWTPFARTNSRGLSVLVMERKL
jgi:GNAT superfamily N-acetyltransferase